MQFPKKPALSRLTADRRNEGPPSRPNAIVVEPQLTNGLAIVSLLTARGFHVMLAESYLEARQCLTTHPPDLLITSVMLGEYNGLGLVLRGKSLRPDMAALALANSFDPVLQADAEAMGATFVQKPVCDTELTAAIVRTLYRQTDADALPIRPPFERRVAPLRSEVVIQFDERRLPDIPGLRARPTAVFKSD